MNDVIFLSNLLEQAFSTMDITEIRKPVIWEITRKIEEAIQKSNPHVIHHFDYEERAVVIFALSWCRVRLFNQQYYALKMDPPQEELAALYRRDILLIHQLIIEMPKAPFRTLPQKQSA